MEENPAPAHARSLSLGLAPGSLHQSDRESTPSTIDLTVLKEVETVTLYQGETYSLWQMLRRALQLDNGDPQGLRESAAPCIPTLSQATRRSTSLEPRTDVGLPENHFAVTYMENYFSTVHPTFPFLLESHVRDALKALYAGEQQRPASCIILYLVMAIGAVFPRSLGVLHMYNSALFFLRATGESFSYDESLETAQIFLLFTIYSLFDPGVGRTWDLVDLAMQMCIVLNLHLPLASQPGKGLQPGRTTESEKTFWTTFVLDL